uniref:Uncharacterized protein n=1 Tax=Ananas comosus var. bracteatus TaxID=296719 RepID=A0A6V7PHH3_ANACO|nr:unnamed protein product [Ananas comosus var. bracteatus]
MDSTWLLQNGDSSHVLRIFDEEAQAMQSARNSSIMLEEAYATGVAILSKYADQRDRLKRAQRKALDIPNTASESKLENSAKCRIYVLGDRSLNWRTGPRKRGKWQTGVCQEFCSRGPDRSPYA